jgi:hypothetical protein
MSANLYAKLDEYGLRHMGEHLYRLGVEYYPQLYKLATARGWHDAQRDFDPSYQTYSNSLDWAFRAARTDKNGLAVLPVVSLLQATVRTLASNVPNEAVVLLSQLENFPQAQAYAEMQTEALAKCERLTKLAISASKEKVFDRAQEAFEKAEATAIEEQNIRTKAQALGLVAECARQIKDQTNYERNIRRLNEILISQPWPFAQNLRKYNLLDQPDYVLSVLEWDRTNRRDPFISAGWLRDESIPVIAGVAAAKKDRSLLDKIISQNKYSILISNDLAAAITKAGCLTDAMEIVFAHHQRGLDSLTIREAMARAAGETGDIDAIEYIVQVKIPSPDAEEIESDYKKDLDERIDDFKDWFAEKAERALKRAGGSVLGIDWEQMVITLAGVEGLLECDPQKGRVLWERLKRKSNRLGKTVASEFEELLFSQSSSAHGQSDRSARLLPKLLNIGTRVAGWKIWDMEGTGTEGMLAELIEIKVQAGDIQGALSDLERIEAPGDYHEALISLVKGTCRQGQFKEACSLVEKIKHPAYRKAALEEIVKSLIMAGPEQVRTTLPRIFTLARYISDEERINHSTQYASLVRSFSGDQPASDTITWMRKIGSDINLSALVSLSQVAAKRKDIRSAKTILAEVENQLSLLQQRNILPASFPATFLHGENTPVQPVDQLAEIVACWTTIVEDSDSQWLDSARQVYALMNMWVNKNKMVEMWCWPALSRAICDLQDRDALLKMLNQMRKAAGPGNVAVDRALVKIAIGLTRTGDYLKPGKNIYPPAVEAIHWKYYKALALAEMAEVVRITPPREGLFGKGLRNDEIDIRVSSLMHQSKVQVGLHNRGSFSPRLKSSLLSQSMLATSPTAIRKAPSAFSTSTEYIPKDVTVEALSKIARIYSRHGMIEETEQIPTLVGDRDRTQILLAVIQALSETGKVGEAQGLLKRSKLLIELVLGGLILTNHDSPQAVKSLERTVPIFQEVLKDPVTLKICLDVTKKFQPAQKEYFIRGCLNEGRQRNRKENVLIVCALAPLLGARVGLSAWRRSVEKVMGAEMW